MRARAVRDVPRGEAPAIAVDGAVVVGRAVRIDRRAGTEVVATSVSAPVAAPPAQQPRHLVRRARVDDRQPHLAAVGGDRQPRHEQRIRRDERARRHDVDERRCSASVVPPGSRTTEARRHVDVVRRPTPRCRRGRARSARRCRASRARAAPAGRSRTGNVARVPRVELVEQIAERLAEAVLEAAGEEQAGERAAPDPRSRVHSGRSP